MKGIWRWIIGILIALVIIGLLGFVHSNRQNYWLARGGGESTFTDIEWFWVSVTDKATNTITNVPDPKMYTIIFSKDGSLEGRADCNNFAGSYSQENGGFFITIAAVTQAYCGEGSLDTQYLSLLASVAAGGQDGAGAFALETAGGAQRMEFVR